VYLKRRQGRWENYRARGHIAYSGPCWFRLVRSQEVKDAHWAFYWPKINNIFKLMLYHSDMPLFSTAFHSNRWKLHYSPLLKHISHISHICLLKNTWRATFVWNLSEAVVLFRCSFLYSSGSQPFLVHSSLFSFRNFSFLPYGTFIPSLFGFVG